MHDAAYKLLYSHHHMVAELLRGFLPDGEAAGFDFDTLEPLPASHVGPALERREGDLIWRLRARAAREDSWVYVLVLLEFQSGVGRSMRSCGRRSRSGCDGRGTRTTIWRPAPTRHCAASWTGW